MSSTDVRSDKRDKNLLLDHDAEYAALLEKSSTLLHFLHTCRTYPAETDQGRDDTSTLEKNFVQTAYMREIHHGTNDASNLTIDGKEPLLTPQLKDEAKFIVMPNSPTSTYRVTDGNFLEREKDLSICLFQNNSLFLIFQKVRTFMLSPLSLNHVCGIEADVRYKLKTPRNILMQRTPTIHEGNSKEKMEEIRNYVHNTFELYEKVYDCCAVEEAFYISSVTKLRHPLIFYYCHTACFYINKLFLAGFSPHINPTFESLCAIGVDEMSWDDLNDEHYDWPSIQEIRDYRLQVRDHIDQMMTSEKFTLELPLSAASSTTKSNNAFWWLMLMGAEHERIHIETASVHIRELPMQYINVLMSSFWKKYPKPGAPGRANELVYISGGSVNIGRKPNSKVYGWDCDYANDVTVEDVPSFKVSKYIVSNMEFFSFMKDDGYQTERYWDEEGWHWVQRRKPVHPWFWVRDQNRPDGYALRLQTELIDLPWDWPCELNNFEAEAFCNYKSEMLGVKLRMPTEAEWILLYDRYIQCDQPEWEKKAPGNLNLEHFSSSCPVNLFQHGDLFDVVGNVWQHCCTPVYPYNGYTPHPYYDDFSFPTFDGKHFSIKGGAWISTGNEATRDARFAFRRYFFQYIGVRYVEGPAVDKSKYLKITFGLDPEVDILTDTSFRDQFAGIPNGYAKIADFAKNTFKTHAKIRPGRVMDFACGAGRISFELTAYFLNVIGVDFTARHLISPFAILERGKYQYSVPERTSGERKIHTLCTSLYPWESTRERASFLQADPTNLPSHLDDFSLIICWNCLERSSRPSLIPAHFLSRLQPGGILIIGGDYDWRNSRNAEAHSTKKDDIAHNPDWILFNGENLQEEIFKLLGGSAAVEQVGGVEKIPVVFPISDHKAEISIVELAAYIKK